MYVNVFLPVASFSLTNNRHFHILGPPKSERSGSRYSRGKSMQAKLSEVIELQADVLVIGGGGAGLRAAISAREGGADVLLVSKSRPGYGNNTAIAGGAFATAGGWREPRDNPQIYKKDALRSGRFINNERLLDVMTEGSVRQVGDKKT